MKNTLLNTAAHLTFTPIILFTALALALLSIAATPSYRLKPQLLPFFHAR